MLRAWMTTRFLPLCLILSLPVSQVTAGPILPHSIGAAGAGGGSPGETGSNSSTRSLTGLGMEGSSAATLGGDPSTGVDGLLAQVLSELSSRPSTGGVVPATDKPVPGRSVSAPADNHGQPAGSSGGASDVSLPGRSAGSSASFASPSNPVGGNLPASRRVGQAGPAGESATNGAPLVRSAGREVSGGTAPSSPGGHAVVGKETGRMSIDPASTSALNAPNVTLRTAGTAGPTSVSPGAAIQAPGSSLMSIPNPGAATPALAQGPGAMVATSGPIAAMAPAAGAATSTPGPIPNPGAAMPALAQGAGATGAAMPALAQGAGATGATSGPIVTMAPGASAATSIPGPGAPAAASPGPSIPAVGPFIDISAPSSTSSTGGTSAAGITPGGPTAGASTALGTSPTGTGALGPGSNGSDSSSSTNLPGGRLNAVGLIALVSTTANPPGTVNDPSLNGAGTSQLNSALGGPNSLTTNPSTSALAVAPTPLAAATPLPPIQASRAVLEGTVSGATGGSPVSSLLPSSIPEPGVLALFAIVSLASAMKRIVRRLRSRDGTRHWASRDPSLQGHVDIGQ